MTDDVLMKGRDEWSVAPRFIERLLKVHYVWSQYNVMLLYYIF